MRKLSKIILFAFCVSLILSISGCSSKNVGKIGDEDLKAYEYKFFLNVVKMEMMNAASITDETAAATYWNTIENKKNAKQTAYDNMVSHKILLSEAKKSGFKLTAEQEKEFTDSINQSIASVDGGEATLIKELDKYIGITLAQYKEIQKNVYLTSKYYESEAKKIAVTDDEITQYYGKNKAKLDSTSVRHILFFTVDTTTGKELAADKVKEAETKANDVLKKVKAGEDIEKLVTEYSEDTSKTDNKGIIEVKNDGTLVKAFQDWGLAAKVGDTGIVKTEYGYHVVKCEAVSTLATLKENIKLFVQDEKMKAKQEALEKDSKYASKKNEAAINKIPIVIE
jgi:foldase protein PrsA